MSRPVSLKVRAKMLAEAASMLESAEKILIQTGWVQDRIDFAPATEHVPTLRAISLYFNSFNEPSKPGSDRRKS